MPARKQSPKKVTRRAPSARRSPRRATRKEEIVVGAVVIDEPSARLRVVHAIPGAPNVDVYLNGRRVLADVPYKAVSDYLHVPAAAGEGVKTKHFVEVKAAGTDKTVLQANIDVVDGASYTLVAHGNITDNKIALLYLADDLSCPADGKARVRFVHASFAAPAVNIYANKTVGVFPNTSYGQAKVNNVDAGVYDLSVTPTNSSKVVLNVPGVDLKNGGVYTVFAIGIPNDTKFPLTALLSEDAKCMQLQL